MVAVHGAGEDEDEQQRQAGGHECPVRPYGANGADHRRAMLSADPHPVNQCQ
jgi:hypothetical protein